MKKELQLFILKFYILDFKFFQSAFSFVPEAMLS